MGSRPTREAHLRQYGAPRDWEGAERPRTRQEQKVAMDRLATPVARPSRPVTHAGCSGTRRSAAASPHRQHHSSSSLRSPGGSSPTPTPPALPVLLSAPPDEMAVAGGGESPLQGVFPLDAQGVDDGLDDEQIDAMVLRPPAHLHDVDPSHFIAPHANNSGGGVDGVRLSSSVDDGGEREEDEGEGTGGGGFGGFVPPAPEYPIDWRRLPRPPQAGDRTPPTWIYAWVSMVRRQTPAADAAASLQRTVAKHLAAMGVFPIDDLTSRAEARDMVRSPIRVAVLVDIVATRRRLLTGEPHGVAMRTYEYLERAYPVYCIFALVGITDNAAKRVARDVFARGAGPTTQGRSGTTTTTTAAAGRRASVLTGGSTATKHLHHHRTNTGAVGKRLPFDALDGTHMMVVHPRGHEGPAMRAHGAQLIADKEAARRARTCTPKYSPPPQPAFVAQSRPVSPPRSAVPPASGGTVATAAMAVPPRPTGVRSSPSRDARRLPPVDDKERRAADTPPVAPIQQCPRCWRHRAAIRSAGVSQPSDRPGVSSRSPAAPRTDRDGCASHRHTAEPQKKSVDTTTLPQMVLGVEEENADSGSAAPSRSASFLRVQRQRQASMSEGRTGRRRISSALLPTSTTPSTAAGKEEHDALLLPPHRAQSRYHALHAVIHHMRRSEKQHPPSASE